MSVLKAALEESGLVIKSYNPEKAKPLRTNDGSLTVGAFAEKLLERLGKKKSLGSHADVVAAVYDRPEMERLVEEYSATELGSTGVSVPEEISHLTLNIDTASTDPGLKKFFCTTQEEFREPSVSGQYYIGKCSLSAVEAMQLARAVVPRYMPRRKVGIHPEIDKVTQAKIDYFNNYIPPAWELFQKRNPREWAKIPAKPPKVIVRLIQHVIPNQEERNYFYAWLYASLTKRSYVYLVLCGLPGVGKNRLKLLMRSLHGSLNASDGKKETFGANQSKFNSQMEENTFLWFDELKYGPDMEPRMKEYQNDYISIEKKGQDATRSTEVFCSMVISNNYPRDNYLLFNSRKFAPLVLGEKPLTASMTPEEINDISERLDDTHPNFDITLVCQIAKWIHTVGPKHLPKWPNLEYQGPKYWELAHTSMSRWQKISVLAMTVQNKNGPFPGWDNTKKAFLWSKVEEALRRKKEFLTTDYRDASTVKAFFETYCNKSGKKIFEVEATESNTLQDFWIKPLQELIKANVSISLNHKNGGAGIIGLERPPGMSDYKWEKLVAEKNKELELQDDAAKDTDLL